MKHLVECTKSGQVSLQAYKNIQKEYGQAMAKARLLGDQSALKDATMGFSMVSVFVKHYEEICK